MTIKDFSEKAPIIHGRVGNNPETIFHYRKLKRIENIIRKKELRFGFFGYLADEEEIKLGHQAILGLIEERSALINYQQKLELAIRTGTSLKFSSSSIFPDFWEYFYKEFVTILDRMSIYILSLADEKDDIELLREYADAGLGASLGFRFKENPPPTNEAGKNHPTYRVRVFYEKDIEAFNRFISYFLDLAEECLLTIPHKDYEDFAAHLASHLIVYLPALKRDSFDFEKEHRLVLPGFIGKDGRRHPNEIEVKELADLEGYKGYHFKYNFKAQELTEIVLGCLVDENTENQIKKWLQEEGYGLSQIQIVRSVWKADAFEKHYSFRFA
ncbi:MAG: DUF2971 domain-containing protein [Alphaproteobacteria bacterium]|nr:DUF2971 domain-containing protein [Alphaproteobacteria bacterium]